MNSHVGYTLGRAWETDGRWDLTMATGAAGVTWEEPCDRHGDETDLTEMQAMGGSKLELCRCRTETDWSLGT